MRSIHFLTIAPNNSVESSVDASKRDGPRLKRPKLSQRRFGSLKAAAPSCVWSGNPGSALCLADGATDFFRDSELEGALPSGSDLVAALDLLDGFLLDGQCA